MESAQEQESLVSLSAIQKESQRMNKIISQLLLLTRGYEGRYHLEKESLELREVIGSVLEELSEMADAAQIQLLNKVPENFILYADQSLLTQLLINLISNSIKYGVAGGRTVIRAAYSKQGCVLSVSDNGIGMSPEDAKHAFERFYRADKARDRSGSGLGLSIAKWIAEIHQGEIAIHSELQKGTEVVTVFPFPNEWQKKS